MKRVKELFHIRHYGLFVICMLLIGTSVSITMPYLSIYGTSELGMTPTMFGFFIAITSLAGVAANTVIANYSDSGMDRKWVILAAVLSSACGYASYLFFESFIGLLLAVSFFTGIGATAMPQLFAYSQESANASKVENKTFAKSTLRSLFSLGFLIGPLIGTLLLAAYDYTGLFLGTSILFIVIAAIVYIFLPKKKIEQTHRPVKKVRLLSSPETRVLILPFLAFILLISLNAINTINTPLFMLNELNGTHADVGFMVALGAGLEIPLMLLFGALSVKISNHTLLKWGCLIGALYFVLLALATEPWHIISAQLFQAILVAIVMGNGLSYFSDIIPYSAGVAATIYANASILGRLGGNVAGGAGADFFGFRDINWLCLILIIVALALLVKKPPVVAQSNTTIVKDTG
ncbi:sugar efflux transporter [Shouchella sp. 1P09AA]|uniref:sugar efflux transporter n=1 Tax=unclassified Shouchella TaxID=2893065 RepID=UPI0039A19F20